MKNENHTLHVIEVNGTPLAGANTAIMAMKEYYPGLVVDDARLDLPSLAVQLVEEFPSFPEMTPAEQKARLARIGHQVLVDMVVNKPTVEAQRGKEELLGDEITQCWATALGRHRLAQIALVGGLRTRLERIRDDRVRILALRGGKTDVVRRLPGISVLQRQFYYCNSVEAAWRACEAVLLPPTKRSGIHYFQEKFHALEQEKACQKGSELNRWGEALSAVRIWENPWLVANTIALLQKRGADIDALGLSNQAIPVGDAHEEFMNPSDAKAIVQEAGSPYGARIAINTAPFRARNTDPVRCREAMIQTVTQLFAEAVDRANIG